MKGIAGMAASLAFATVAFLIVVSSLPSSSSLRPAAALPENNGTCAACTIVLSLLEQLSDRDNVTVGAPKAFFS